MNIQIHEHFGDRNILLLFIQSPFHREKEKKKKKRERRNEVF